MASGTNNITPYISQEIDYLPILEVKGNTINMIKAEGAVECKEVMEGCELEVVEKRQRNLE